MSLMPQIRFHHKFFLICIIILAYGQVNNSPVLAQDFQSLRAAEDTLAAILTRLNQAEDDSLRYAINDSFRTTLLNIMMLPGADDAKFESLKTLIKITSDDNRFRIFHWNLPTQDGRKKYFGFLKLLRQSPPAIFPLTDFSDSIASPDTVLLDCNHWFGALYYKVISGKNARGKQYYTLLGWAGNNAAITQKVIEILSFDDQGIPQFGLPVFPNYARGNNTRVVFRYSASTTMSLKYEEQPITSEKKWDPKKRGFDEKSRNALMIVFDRLVPLDPQLERLYQFYVAAGDVFDGFQFTNGSWNFIQGIEPKNKH
jgi:hypothetical protein